MAKIRVDGSDLVVEMEGVAEVLMAMRSEVKVPLAHVSGVRADPPELFDETFIARVFGASLTETHLGYFWKKGDGLVFVDIHHLHAKGQIVAVDLHDERMKHLYVETSGETAAAAVARLAPLLKG